MHKVSISSQDGKTQILLNGMDISKRCLGFRLEQDGSECPVIHLKLLAYEVEVSAEASTTKERLFRCIESQGTPVSERFKMILACMAIGAVVGGLTSFVAAVLVTPFLA